MANGLDNGTADSWAEVVGSGDQCRGAKWQRLHRVGAITVIIGLPPTEGHFAVVDGWFGALREVLSFFFLQFVRKASKGSYCGNNSIRRISDSHDKGNEFEMVNRIVRLEAKSL